jgi:hypothetical protein
MFIDHFPRFPGSSRPSRLLVVALALALSFAMGCDSASDTPSEAEARQILEGQPSIFVEKDDHYSLEGLDGIELGDTKDQALEKLEDICPQTMEYRVGKLGGNAWFRGCEFDKPQDGVVSVRVGFWPKLDDRVATLEVKREGLSAPVVSERFRQFVGGVESETVRSGFVQMRAKKYQMMADWDEGKDGPAHIATGFNPDNIDSLELAQ